MAKLQTVKPMRPEELKQLHTGSLLSRLKELRALQDRFEVSDWLPAEIEALEIEGLIAFKETDIWKNAFTDVKIELSTRDHYPRGSKEKRQQAALKEKYR